MCELRPSNMPDAGLGVFTTRNFKQGELVCYYDVTRIAGPDENMTEQERKYALYINGGRYVGDWMAKTAGAQFINDAATIPQIIDEAAVEIEIDGDYIRQIAAYFISATKCNVYNHGRLFYCLYDIPADTELLYHYGYRYWTHGRVTIIEQVLDDIFAQKPNPQQEAAMFHDVGIWLNELAVNI